MCRVEGNFFHVMRKNLNDHIESECPNRTYKCEFCGEQSTYTTITEDHDKQCMKKPIPCPNTECPLTVERGGVEEHVASECEHTIVDCKYSNIGCPERKKRRVMNSHEEDDKAHLRLSLNKVSQLDETVTQLQLAMMELTNKLDKKVIISVDVPDYTLKKKTSEEFFSQPFFTIPNKYKMRFSVCCNGHGVRKGTHLSVFFYLLKVPYKDQLKWPFRGTVTVKLLNQLEDNNHHEATINCKDIDIESGMSVSAGCGKYRFIPLSSLEHNATANTQYLVNDTLHFRVTVQEMNDRTWLD